jgi:hypothetical protein
MRSMDPVSNLDRDPRGENRRFRKVPGHDPVRVDPSDECPAECSCGWTSHREEWVKHLILLMVSETRKVPYRRQQVAASRAYLEKHPDDPLAKGVHEYALREEAKAIAREQDGPGPDEFSSSAG